MKLFERLHGTSGIKIIVGSAFFWAWLDAMFMSAFFVPSGSQGFMSEVATIYVFAFSVPGFILAMTKNTPVRTILASKKALMGTAILGTAGSLLYLLAGYHHSWLVLVVGGLCAGVFMTAYQLGWGSAYCKEGARSATPYVAGGFAGAILIDIPLLFMVPEASAIFFALLPLISGIFLVLIDPADRTYRPYREPLSDSRKTIFSSLKTYLGISIMILAAVMLVAISFGYMQHLMSFSSIMSGDAMGGILIQVVRGLTAIAVFVLVVLASGRSSIVYRIGLLAMIAGFMMMSFLFRTDYFWVSGAVIIGGYTVFDLLIWVVVSQSAYAQSHNALKTISVMRLIAILCYVVGAVIGILFVGNAETLNEFVSAETTVVGYLVVIAVVLLLSSEDVWVLLGGARALRKPDNEGDAATQNKRLEAWFTKFGLTAREKEIATLLAYGRTQPWVAKHLNISENTVGTHVRHIYQKAEVHNRQQFIDVVSSDISLESRDNEKEVTDNT